MSPTVTCKGFSVSVSSLARLFFSLYSCNLSLCTKKTQKQPFASPRCDICLDWSPTEREDAPNKQIFQYGRCPRGHTDQHSTGVFKTFICIYNIGGTNKGRKKKTHEKATGDWFRLRLGAEDLWSGTLITYSFYFLVYFSEHIS